ncbi:hypothetical protein LTS08_001149 [Lithohypha guttulata]|nr:hypothetical protein LTS08_001149 [Lithohypha guttulata]
MELSGEKHDDVYSTRDAVEDIWGPRTGYKPGEKWPTRVDEHCIEKPERWIQSACVMCSNGCGMDIAVSNSKIVGVRGREVDRINHGRLGPKGLYAWKSLQSKDRLQYPMIRRNGKLERATWDEAMNLIVEKSKEIRERLTAHAIGFYTSGQLFLEEYYALAMVCKAGLNTLHEDGNTRLCTATAAASMRENFGSDGQPGSYTDIDHTACIMLVGHNMAATQTVLWSRILDRLAGPDPPQLIVIDPRKSNSAKKATLHLAPKIGTNCALLNGIEYLIFKKGYVNEPFVSKSVCNLDKLWDTVQEYPPDVVSKITGVSEADIEKAADILGRSSSLLSTALQGVYQSNQATASACQINNINLLLGQIGKPGSGIYQMNGQPTAQNNREAGCNGEYPGFRNHQNPRHMQELADLWNIDMARVPHWAEPTHIENMLTFIDGGSMEMFWISGTNPLVSLPNLAKARSTLTDPNLFVVVQDIFPTETTAIADVVLPAAAWGEKTGCFTNVDRTVHISHKAVEPPGEAKADIEIFIDYAKRMGFKDKDGKPLLKYSNSNEAFEGWKALSKGRPCDYSGLSYEKLSEGSGLQWPCNKEHPNGCERLFSNGVFYTDIEYCESYGHDLETGAPLSRSEYESLNPAGRAILKPCHYLAELEAVDDEYPFHISTGRRARHFHTRTKTGRTKELQQRDPEPYIQINERDAEKLGIKEGDMVLAESRRGKIEAVARVGDISEGQTFIPFHYGYFDNHSGRATAANEITQEQWDPVSKQPMFKSGAVKLKKVSQDKNTNGEVKVHAREPQSDIVKKVETEKKTQGDNTKVERMLEYWLGATYGALVTAIDICDHVVPRIEGADFEIGTGMRIMQRIATSCTERLDPILERYETEKTLGQEMAKMLQHRLFPEDLVTAVEAPAYEILLTIQSFFVYLSHIESRLHALRPTAGAAWDQEFVETVDFVTEQVNRMQAWAKQQLGSRSTQVLLVPNKHAVGLKERVESRAKLGMRDSSHPDH